MKSKNKKIIIQKLTSGDSLSITVYEFKGKPGEKVYIQANIHGPEVAGIMVVKELIKTLEKTHDIKGTITLVISANPVGLNYKANGFPVGYINHNGDSAANWNRIYLNLTDEEKIKRFISNNSKQGIEKIYKKYKSFLKKELEHIGAKKSKYGLKIEDKIALTIQKISVEADFVIDLHSAALNQQHIYAFSSEIESAKYFGIQHFIEIPCSFTGALDEASFLPWNSLALLYEKIIGKKFLNKNEAFTLELENDNQINSKKTDEYLGKLLNYLKEKKILPGKAVLEGKDFKKCLFNDYVKYYAPCGGLVESLVILGQEVKKGSPLVKIHTLFDGTVYVYCQKKCTINTFPLSSVVSEGEPVVGVLEKLKNI